MRNFNEPDAVKIPLILASGSPRRKQLLEQIGLEFEVCPSQVHENFCLNLSPEAFTEHWAKEKAMDVAKSNPQSLVVAADTIVVLDHKILGKPKNKKDSYRMLKCLSGRTHKVITGMHFSAGKYNIDRTINEQTQVLFNTLSDSDIYYYIDNYRPFDKAGSYGIQDWFSVQVKKVDGCYFNVMGLPLAAFYKEYRQINNQLEIL